MEHDRKRVNTKLSAQVINCLEILEIEDHYSLPKMKTVRKKFLKIVKSKHPDGEGNEEDFVELLEAKEWLMNYLKINSPMEDTEDEEERLVRQEFELANIHKINTDSVTIYVPTAHVASWNTAFEKKYGPPAILPVKKGAGPTQFKTQNGIAVTIWRKEQSAKSTMLIQGRDEYLDFTRHTLPMIFNSFHVMWKVTGMIQF